MTPEYLYEDVNSNIPKTYSALSYFWGSEKATGTITVFSKNRAFWIAIRPNLEGALRELRHQKNDILLWIDALCMNQEDKEEKVTRSL